MQNKHDVLFEHLNQLKKDDLKQLLTVGLRLKVDKIKNLMKKDLIELCSKELRAAAGSSTLNTVRDDHAFPYKQILIDVADKLSPGHTLLSWTDYTIDDDHSESEIEETIALLFEDRAKQWWNSLSDEKKKEFVGGINVAMGGAVSDIANSGGVKTFVTQQMIENIIQTGIMTGLSKVAAVGIFGSLGMSVIAQIGWFVVLQTVGWMGGVKIALFGLGGHGALGGAVGGIGGAVVGGLLSIPTLYALVDGTAYRKTVPTVVLLVAKHRAAMLTHSVERI